MKIINFGSLNIDRVYTVERFVQPGETLTSKTFNEFAGGKGLNQSIALARAGARVYHAGKLGKDGEFLRRTLLDEGVDVSLVHDSKTHTGHAIIQVDRTGENSIILFGGANRSITRQEIHDTLTMLENGDRLLLQNEINGIHGILTIAAERDLKVIFNPAPMTRDVQQLPLDAVEWLVLNRVEAEMMTGRQTPDEMMDSVLARYPDVRLILTLGEQGACFAHEKDRFFMPAQPVRSVDTTGAGDTFIGFFFAEMIKGSNITDCLALATKAAAVCITREGAAISIPTRNELDIISG